MRPVARAPARSMGAMGSTIGGRANWTYSGAGWRNGGSRPGGGGFGVPRRLWGRVFLRKRLRNIAAREAVMVECLTTNPGRRRVSVRMMGVARAEIKLGWLLGR